MKIFFFFCFSFFFFTKLNTGLRVFSFNGVKNLNNNSRKICSRKITKISYWCFVCFFVIHLYMDPCEQPLHKIQNLWGIFSFLIVM